VSFLFDTDICSAHLRGNGRVFNRFVQHGGGLCVSVVSVAELYTWASRAAPPRRREGLKRLLAEMTVANVDPDVARRCGEVRARLLDQGRTVPTTDLLIASTALVHELVLVTHNVQHFASVPDLRIEDWLAA
jgi:tRNA(fMet)-specific endonuclease VapC